MLLKHSDIEIYVGLKKKLSKCFSFCHWNVSNILAHNKLSLLTEYNSAFNYDLISLTETYLSNKQLIQIIFQLILITYLEPTTLTMLNEDIVCLYYKENLTL